MSESENQTAKKEKTPLGIILVVFGLLTILLGIGLISNLNIQKEKIMEETSTEKSSDTFQIEDTTSPEQLDTSYKLNENATVIFDLEKASTPRILGNLNAPIKISEHSSFTCGHCAKFHKTNFKRIKEDFIDTGKAYIVFDDFPLNPFDIKVGSIARCVPDKSYFNFVQLLFETQKEWKNKEFIAYVKQNAKLTGSSEAQLDSCLNSVELHETLAQHREAAMQKYGVNSTPTLIINDSIVMPGLDAYEKIKRTLDAELEKTVK